MILKTNEKNHENLNQPEDGEGGSPREVGKPSHLDAADCPRKFN